MCSKELIRIKQLKIALVVSVVLGLQTSLACTIFPVGQTSPAQTDQLPTTIPPVKFERSRATVFISDLHMGIGRGSAGQWDPTEDFRWSAEMESFLDEISRKYENRIDLVIVGDLLELWQPREDMICTGKNADYGCTDAEIEAITAVVVKAHRQDLAALGAFANKGENRIYIIPGNHDAALLLDRVWKLVHKAINIDQENRVIRVKSGIWVSADGKLVAE